MPNLHTPERLEGETVEQYKARRAFSRNEVKRQTNSKAAAQFQQDKRYQNKWYEVVTKWQQFTANKKPMQSSR